MRDFKLASDGATIALLTSTLILLLPSSGRADIWCQVSSHKGSTIDVHEQPGGSVVNRLQSDRAVRREETEAGSKRQSWVQIAGVYHGEWRVWGWVSQSDLKCVDTDKFPRDRISARALKAVGIVPQSVTEIKTMPVSCNEVPNGWGVTISEELYAAYRRRGFSREAVCLALGSSDALFDPATGKRLNLYEIPGDISGLRPLWLPDCYRKIEITGKGGYLVGWRPAGCTMRYHPQTGLPIQNVSVVELSSGGEAGGGVDEDNRSSTVSKERLRSLVNGK